MSMEAHARLAGATEAVERGLAFLAGSQLASGQFPTYVGADVRADPMFESSPFTTARPVRRE